MQSHHSLAYALKMIVWSIAATALSIMTLAINPVTSAIVNCSETPTYFNFQSFLCSPWPAILFGFQFVVISVLLGPRKVAFHAFLIVPFVYVCSWEMLKIGLVGPFDFLSMSRYAFSLQTGQFIGALAASCILIILFRISNFRTEAARSAERAKTPETESIDFNTKSDRIDYD